MEREPAVLLDVLVERLALDERHHQEQLAVGQGAKVINVDDVLVLHTRSGEGLTLEPATNDLVPRELAEEHLDDLALVREPLVLGDVDGAHATFGKFGPDDVASDWQSDHRIAAAHSFAECTHTC